MEETAQEFSHAGWYLPTS